MKLTKEKAFELSIEKWEWIVGNNGDSRGLDSALPVLDSLASGCGLCQYDIEKHPNHLDACRSCPINIGFDEFEDNGCEANHHPFRIWSNNKTKQNAQAVLDLIKEKYEEHLKRYYKKS